MSSRPRRIVHLLFGLFPALAGILISQSANALPPAVAGEGKFVSADLAGVVIQDGHDVSVSSAPHTIGPSNHYRFDVSGTVHGTGPVGGQIPAGTDLADALNSIDPGSGNSLRGAVLENIFGDTYPLVNKTINGSQGPLSISGRIESGVENGIASFALKDFAVTFFGTHDSNDTIVFDKVHLLGYSADIIKSDFSVDASSDLVLYDPRKRQAKIALLNGSAFLNKSAKKSVVSALGGAKLPAGFAIAGTGDFDLDGNPDLLLVNAKSGATKAILMDLQGVKNNSVADSTIDGPTIPAGFKIGAVGDFNLDGAWDLALYNPATLAAEALLLSKNLALLGADLNASTVPLPALPAGSVIQGASDFNDDGMVDLLLYYPKTRASSALLLNGTAQTGTIDGPVIPKGWTLVGSSGFDNNRSIDLVIFNAKTAQAKFYLAAGDIFSTLPKKPGHALSLPQGVQLLGPR